MIPIFIGMISNIRRRIAAVTGVGGFSAGFSTGFEGGTATVVVTSGMLDFSSADNSGLLNTIV